MNNTFDFQIHNKMLFGIGRSKELDKFISIHGFKDVLVFVDEGVHCGSDYWIQVLDILSKTATVDITVISGAHEPDYEYLDEIVEAARSKTKPDLIIGIGGGSAMDVAKAAAVLITNPGKGLSYRGFDNVTKPGIPTLLVPTTAGTGSEVTVNAVFIDRNEMRKLGINGRYMSATYALLDAEWTLSCPTGVMLSAGVDALTHSLESFCCKQHNLVTRMLSRQAFSIIYRNLPIVLSGRSGLQERQDLLLGAYLAGAALFNSGSGIAGAFSYPLGVHFNIPHGICGGIFLASVVEYNAQNGYQDYAELYDLINPGNDFLNSEKSIAFSKLLTDFSELLNIPVYLDAYGVTRQDIFTISRHLQGLQGAFDQNPVPFDSRTDAINLLSKHIR